MKKYLILPILLLVTMLVWSAFGAYLKYDVFVKIGMQTDENIVTLPFVLLCDRQVSYTFSSRMDNYLNPTEPTQEAPTTVPTTENTEPTQEAATVPETEPVETTEIIYEPVDESWFDDALFIGESRIDGLKLNSRLGAADYFSGTNLTVFDIPYCKCSDRNYVDIKLEDLLRSKQYGKIYIHLGINECGSELDLFEEQYRKVIQMVRQLQPEAHIILMSILPVTKDWSTNPIFRRQNLLQYDERIKSLADGERIHYIDNRLWAADEEGYLRGELTNDGCHPHADGNYEWAQWLRESAAQLNIP
jgi:hypothetical protein